MMFLIILFSPGCETETDSGENHSGSVDNLQQLKLEGDISGSLNPFELIENPAYSPIHEIDYMSDGELVFITRACGYLQVFPHRSMHVEVVNEAAHGVLMAITYCPITRSGINWNRVAGEDTLLFTASGYLYKENLMPLDVNSGSIWSQMLLRGLYGEHIHVEIQTFPLIETTWKTVREYFPGAGVFVNKSLFKSAESVPLGQEFGIVGWDGVELFTLDMFPGEIKLKTSLVNPGGRIVVAGSTSKHFIVAFMTRYHMDPVEGKFPVIMIDETGTYWNIFGEAVSGERGGEKLESPVFFSAADWAWRDLYDHVSYSD